MSPQDIASHLGHFENREYKIFGCSAMKKEGLSEAFEWLMSVLEEKKEVHVGDDLELIY